MTRPTSSAAQTAGPMGRLPDTVQGALWALIAAGAFAVVAAMAKVAVTEYHVLQILFFRQVVVFLSSVPTVLSDVPRHLKTRRPGLHVVRLLGAFTALSFSIWAVQLLPLTTAITLSFARAFFVALLAAVILKEVVGPHRVWAVIFGFVGVVIVMRPGIDGLIHLHTLIPLVGALAAAVTVICVRSLSQTEATATLVLYQAVFVGLLAALPLPWLWTTPDMAGLILLLSMGVVSAIGQWVGVRALRLGEASVLGNIQYTQLIYAAILGHILFAEVPDRYTLIGAGVIVLSSLALLRAEMRQR